METDFTEHYDQNTPVTIGRYKYVMIKNIPKSYIEESLKSFKNGVLKEFLKEYVKQEITETEVRTCYKKTFLSEKEAIESRDKLNMTSRLKKKNIELRVYKCEVCGFHHLTSKKLKT